ncbi:MAG: hypothetical protein LBR12_04960, partial [Opitutaceae bacterium]|nr:hypothetical protein [Opitutaceae bacterium]
MRKELRPFLALALPFVPQAAVAWDYEGHRAVNQIALAALPPDFPSFVRDPAVAERIAFLSGEPDRWRNSAENALHNCNKPEHYIDAEDPADAGLPLATLTPFRYVFIARYDKARRADPARFPPVAPEKNRDGVRDLCGLLPWAIIENYGRIEAVFSRLKTLARDRAPDEELAAARAAAAYLMGVMGHYVGDATQPLHTTKHHNGWSGPNPNRYTTSRKIHAWIDGGVFARASFDTGKLRAAARPPEKLPPPVASAPGGTPPLHSAILSWIGEQNRRVEPLYRLVRSNDLAIDATPTKRGEDFIGEQLLRGGRMLASLWLAAWQNAAPPPPPPHPPRPPPGPAPPPPP